MTATPVWKRGKAVRHWCRYCGCILKITNTSGVCPAHADLPRLDPQTPPKEVKSATTSGIICGRCLFAAGSRSPEPAPEPDLGGEHGSPSGCEA